MKTTKYIAKSFFLLLVTALFWAMPATSWGVNIDGIEYSLDSSKMTASVAGYSGSPTAVTIPAVINDGGKDYTVTSIGDMAFGWCDSLTSIEIPAGVTQIGDFAFSDCTRLTSIEIPADVTRIGRNAFGLCKSLASITFAGGSKLENIGIATFNGCRSLTSIEIPAGVTEIRRGAFENCTGLASVTFGKKSKLESIGDYAFCDCTSLESIKIPASVTSIGKEAFDSHTKVTLAGDGLTVGSGKDPEKPEISFNFIEGKLVLAFTGTLEGSEDGKQWTAINAVSPYTVEMIGAKKFFRARGEGSEDVGENFIIPLSETVNLEMIWVKSGTFIMGSPEGELGRYSDETRHQVTLTKGYWLGKYEVTQRQYEFVMGSNPSYFRGENLPVERVTWHNAMDFCAKLTEMERAAGRLPAGYEYTLPTEAQWEYACRAGTKEALNNGKNLTDEDKCFNLDEVGWYFFNSDQTHPVGEKQPNAWGFYDMHGNVYEWCLDWYGDYPTDDVDDVTDPTGPATGSYRVIRGGGWDSYASYCRSAKRSYIYPSSSYYDAGFRVALSPVQ